MIALCLNLIEVISKSILFDGLWLMRGSFTLSYKSCMLFGPPPNTQCEDLFHEALSLKTFRHNYDFVKSYNIKGGRKRET